jgi:hypothetical protein
MRGRLSLDPKALGQLPSADVPGEKVRQHASLNV